MNELNYKNAIEICGLTKEYKGFSLSNINLNIPIGSIVGLVGENGAGKTTTIKSILGIVKPTSGSIKLLGTDIVEAPAKLRDDLGVVIDEVGMVGCFKTKQIDKIMVSIYDNWDSKKFHEYVERFNIPTDKEFSKLSKGTKMKIGIAVALSHNPKLLILDEATSGLDPIVRDEILDIFIEFTRDEKNSVLISSHIVSDLEKVCDYIAFLHEGKLMLFEAKDALSEKYGAICVSPELFEALDKSAVIGSRKSIYNVEAIVLRDKIPADIDITPVSIEDLFIYMVKGER